MPRLLTIAGKPRVLYGIVASAGWAGHATPWLAAVSTMAHDEITTVMWLSRLQADAWQRRWPVLQAVCDVRNHFHREWLEWLDFVPQGRVEAFGAAGLPFDLYRRAPLGIAVKRPCERPRQSPCPKPAARRSRPFLKPKGEPCVGTSRLH